MVSSVDPAPTAAAGRTARPLRITVLCGGPSAEREVSLASGRAVAAALVRLGHRVHVADISPDDCAALDVPADVVFPVLHGTFGEDGQLQVMLEARGQRFVGSGSRASALAMDKLATKRLVQQTGLLTPEYSVVAALPAALPAFGVPCVVKPIDQGSSVLTTIVRDAAAFSPAVAAVVDSFGRALGERFIAGREVTVGIVGGEVLPPITIRPRREFYDYAAKYEDSGTEYLFDAGHAPALLERVREDSLRVFALLGCRHLARMDWIVDTQERHWFLEANTLPGFTSHSLVPMAAERSGCGFDQLCERLVRLAGDEP